MGCMLKLGASLCAQACILTQCAHVVLVHSNNASLHCVESASRLVATGYHNLSMLFSIEATGNPFPAAADMLL